jgi:hypothetical protein
MRLKTRLHGLESNIASTATGSGCEVRPLALHHAWVWPSGEEVILPPVPSPRPPCTCRPPKELGGIECILVHIGPIESREAAERDYLQPVWRGT